MSEQDKYKIALVKAIIDTYRERETLDLIVSGQWSPYYIAIVDLVQKINKHLGKKLSFEQHIQIIQQLAKTDQDITFVYERMSIVCGGQKKYHFVAISRNLLLQYLRSHFSYLEEVRGDE